MYFKLLLRRSFLILLAFGFQNCTQKNIESTKTKKQKKKESRNKRFPNYQIYRPIHWAADCGAIKNRVINVNGENLIIIGIENLKNLNTNWNETCDDKDEWTPLFKLCEVGYDKALKKFIELADNLDVNAEGKKNGCTPLLAAICNRHNSCLDILLQHKNINPNLYYGNLGSPLYHAVVEDNQYAFMKLIENNADINYYCVQNKYTLLHMLTILESVVPQYEQNMNIQGKKCLILRRKKILKYLNKILEIPEIDANKPNREKPIETPIFFICKTLGQKVAMNIAAQKKNKSKNSIFITPIYFIFLKKLLNSKKNIKIYQYVSEILGVTQNVWNNINENELNKDILLDYEMSLSISNIYNKNSSNNMSMLPVLKVKQTSNNQPSIKHNEKSSKKTAKIKDSSKEEEKYSEEKYDEGNLENQNVLHDKYNSMYIKGFEDNFDDYSTNGEILKQEEEAFKEALNNHPLVKESQKQEDHLSDGIDMFKRDTSTIFTKVKSYLYTRIQSPVDFSMVLENKLLSIFIAYITFCLYNDSLTSNVMILFCLFLMVLMISSLMSYQIASLQSSKIDKIKLFEEKIYDRIPIINRDKELKEIILRFVQDLLQHMNKKTKKKS